MADFTGQDYKLYSCTSTTYLEYIDLYVCNKIILLVEVSIYTVL